LKEISKGYKKLWKLNNCEAISISKAF